MRKPFVGANCGCCPIFSHFGKWAGFQPLPSGKKCFIMLLPGNRNLRSCSVGTIIAGVYSPHAAGERDTAYSRHQARGTPWWWSQPRWMSTFDRGASSIILSYCAAKWNFKTGQRLESIRVETAAARPKGAYPANYALTDYEAIFAYGDTPEDFAMLALVPLKSIAGRRHRHAASGVRLRRLRWRAIAPLTGKKRCCYPDHARLLLPVQNKDLPSFSRYRNLPEVAAFRAGAITVWQRRLPSMNNSVPRPLLRMRVGSSLP